MNELDKAIALAKLAHRGQKDKGGEDYIMHLYRVSDRLADPELSIVGMLHDIIEDTSVTIPDLVSFGFDDIIVILVEVLTRQDDEDYQTYIERVKRVPDAVTVKLVDLQDNMNMNRITNPTREDQKRTNRYIRAYNYLTGATEVY